MAFSAWFWVEDATLPLTFGREMGQQRLHLHRPASLRCLAVEDYEAPDRVDVGLLGRML